MSGRQEPALADDRAAGREEDSPRAPASPLPAPSGVREAIPEPCASRTRRLRRAYRLSTAAAGAPGANERNSVRDRRISMESFKGGGKLSGRLEKPGSFIAWTPPHLKKAVERCLYGCATISGEKLLKTVTR